MDPEQVKKQLLHRRLSPALTGADFLSTGSMMLNLACTDHAERGFARGYYYLIVGDTRSGKTFLTLTCLAEAALNPHFNKHRFIHDDAEQGALMDIRRFFGAQVAARIEPPERDGHGQPVYSRKVEDFYRHLDNAVKVGRPFIYILDSQDSLDSNAAEDKFQEQMKDMEEGREITGSYTDGKAKIHSSNLRRYLQDLKNTGSILIVVNQTRDKMGARYSVKTRSGGWALPFYATIEIWSSIEEEIFKTVHGKKRSQGIRAQIKVRKNRVNGKDRSVVIPIYYSYGIDDVGSCVDFLLEEKHWYVSKKGGLIVAPEFRCKLPRERLIQQILTRHAQRDLGAIVEQVWCEIEKALNLSREPRYV